MTIAGNIGNRIKLARDSVGLSQSALGKLINASQSTVSDWELGKEVPPDMIAKIAEVTGSLDLRIEYMANRRLLLLNVPYLNNVDHHPMTVLAALREEFEEALESIDHLEKLFKNKQSSEDFEDWEWNQVLDEVEQVVDPTSGLNVFLSTLSKSFNLDLKALSFKLTQKYFNKKYIKI